MPGFMDNVYLGHPSSLHVLRFVDRICHLRSLLVSFCPFFVFSSLRFPFVFIFQIVLFVKYLPLALHYLSFYARVSVSLLSLSLSIRFNLYGKRREQRALLKYETRDAR